MAQKSAKKKPKKAAKASPEASVMGALPSHRPTRLGGERRDAATATKATTTKAAKSGATKATATKPAKPKAAKPKKARHVTQPPRTEAPPAGWQTPGEGDRRRDGGPVELVTTAVQAAGELAQLGLTVGGQILRRAANRLPGR
jgi:hypothetical protein